jgi:hypothetical protein
MAGGATGGRQGCESGGIGAVVGELAGKWYDSDGSKTDAQILEFVKVIAAAAGAVTGDGSAASVSTAVMTAVNAVQNNLLATRDVKKLMEQLGQCSGSQCDAIKRLYTGLMQTSTGGLEGLCKANPQACAGQLPDYVQALKEMQTPEFKALVGDETANRLIDRQVADLNKVVSALNWGNEHAESSKQIVKAAMLVGATAAGGGLMLAVGRAVVAACGSGVLTPACTGLMTELGVGVAEAASGVPTLGVSVPVATAAAVRLAQAADASKDANVVAKELQAVLAEARTGAVSVGEVGNGIKVYPDGSLRTADGKFASVSGSPAPGTTAASNYAAFLKNNGINVVGQEMVVNGPVGLRRYDIVVQDIFGNLQGIEIKSGGAVKSTYQDFTDRFVNQFGASGAGRLDGKSVTSAITIYVP